MQHGAQPFATEMATDDERKVSHGGTRSAHSHEEAHNNKHDDVHLKVLLYTSEPYIDSERGGFYYAIWTKIKETLNTMKHLTPGKVGMTHYYFTEKFVPGYFLEYSELDSSVYDDYDVIIGMFDGVLPFEVHNKGWRMSNPLFVHSSVVVRLDNFNFIGMFYNLFFKKYVPLLSIFIVMSIILGQVLFKYTRRMSRKNAVWQTLSAMMGEFGYLSEKLSDHYKTISYFGYFVNMVIFIICLYCFLYIQATINTTMIYSNKSSMYRANNSIVAGDKPQRYMTNQKHVARKNLLSSRVDLRDDEQLSQYESTKAIIEDYKSNTREFHEYSGLILDGVMLEHITANTSDDSYFVGDAASRVGVGFLVRDAGLLTEVNYAIHRLHASDDIRNICNREMKHYSPSAKNQCAM